MRRRARAQPVPPKGRSLVRQALMYGRVKPRGAGEASSKRALVRRGLLSATGEPTEDAKLWAEVRGERNAAS